MIQEQRTTRNRLLQDVLFRTLTLVRMYGLDIFSGHLFVFVSRNRERAKILTWSDGGFVLYYKRLERGRFKVPRPEEGQSTILLEPAQLMMLLEGIDFSRVRRPRRWRPSA